jgi:hypothetical protein
VLTLSVTVMLAVREPVVLGANVTSIVPLSVGASELGQRWVGVKLSPECVAVGVRGPRVPKVIPQLPAVSSRPEPLSRRKVFHFCLRVSRASCGGAVCQQGLSEGNRTFHCALIPKTTVACSCSAVQSRTKPYFIDRRSVYSFLRN